MEKNIPLLLLLTTLTIITSSLLLLRRWRRKPSPPLPPSPPSLPIIGHLHLLPGLPFHQRLLHLSRFHGPIFLLRLGIRRAVIISSPATVHECLIKKTLNFSNRPIFPKVKDLTYQYTSFGNPPFGPLWQNQRHIANAALFSPAIIQSLSATIIHQELKVLLRSLFRKGEGEVRVYSKISELVTNVMMRAIAGERCFRENDGEATEIGRKYYWLVEEFFQAMNESSGKDFFPFLKWVGAGNKRMKRIKRLERKMDDFCAELLEEGRKRRSKKNGNISSVVDALLEMQEKEGKEKYDEVYLKGMLQGLLTAGTRTINHQLEWTMALLLNNPESKNKAVSEINAVVGSGRLLDHSDLPDLPYLNNVVKESLRLCPAAPLLAPRDTRNDCTIGGFYAPAGTMLIVNAYAMHRDPAHWADPTSFKPERYFEENKDLGAIYFPFGKGRRICPGSELALRVMTMALGCLLQCFEWDRVGEELVDMSEGPEFELSMLNPLVAKYRARQPMLPLLSAL